MIALKVEGMTCMGCVRSVEKALAKADPTAAVKVDLAEGRVDIDSAVGPETLIRAIEAAGYDVVR